MLRLDTLKDKMLMVKHGTSSALKVSFASVLAGSFLGIGCQKLRGEKYQISRRRRTSSSIPLFGPLRQAHCNGCYQINVLVLDESQDQLD